MEQQTSVEWLEAQLMDLISFNTVEMRELYRIKFEQAKQIEKEQREQDFIEGYKKRAELSNLIFDKASELFAKSLFNETFKTK